MRKVSLTEKIALILFGVLLALLFLELGLRFGSFILNSDYKKNSRITANAINDQKTYKILCLGESTTASQSSSWTSQLYELINEKSNHINFVIFNEAKLGTNSALLLSSLKENLEKYKPDMVIAMMGINDAFVSNLYYDRSSRSKSDLFLNQIQVYKLGKLIIHHLGNQNFLKDNKKIEKEIYNAYSEKVNFYINNKKYEDLEITYNELLKINKSDYFVYSRLCQLYIDQEKYAKAEKACKDSLRINPDYEDALLELIFIYQIQGKISNAEELAYEREMVFFDLREETEQAFENTKYHYLLLYNITKERNTKLVVMQYPTRDIQDFKDFFTEEQQKDIIFISNKENFEEALNNSEYEEIFRDKFAMGAGYHFGHCTEKGNRLIAENVANTLLNYLNITD
jgi:tetratricopeptide (TPR) repeat protein